MENSIAGSLEDSIKSTTEVNPFSGASEDAKKYVVLNFLQNLKDSRFFSALTLISFVFYYLMLGVYAIFNVYTIAHSLGLHSSLCMIVSTSCAMSALINEYIDAIVTNEKESFDNPTPLFDSFSFFGEGFTKRNISYLLPFSHAFLFSSLFLALGDISLRTFNMVSIQLGQSHLFPKLEICYYIIFIGGGVIGLGLTYVTNIVKYQLHVLFPSLVSVDDTKNESKQVKKSDTINLKKQNIIIHYFDYVSDLVDKKFPFLNLKGFRELLVRFIDAFYKKVKGYNLSPSSFIEKLTLIYLTNEFYTYPGLLIGACLYGLGDYVQLFGLLNFLNQSEVLSTSSYFRIAISLSFFLGTFSERLFLWGYNFKQYAKNNNKITDSKKYQIGTNKAIKLIDRSPELRRFCSFIRLAAVWGLNILSAILLFKGSWRYLGFATSAGYTIVQMIQVSFQSRKSDSDPKEPSSGSFNYIEPIAKLFFNLLSVFKNTFKAPNTLFSGMNKIYTLKLNRLAFGPLSSFKLRRVSTNLLNKGSDRNEEPNNAYFVPGTPAKVKG